MSDSSGMEVPHLSQEEMVSFLRGVSLFTDLDEESLESLARVSMVRRLPKGSIVFFQEDPGNAAFVVYAGAVSISLTTADGRELVINEMRPGDCFGELALFGGEPRSATATAREPSGVIRIPQQEFLSLLDEQPEIMRQLLMTMAGRLRLSSERERALAFLDAPARIARFLLYRAEHYEDFDDVVTFSQEEVAQYIGVTRQTVAKVLADWREAGWIITGRGRIMLVNRKKLQDLANKDSY